MLALDPDDVKSLLSPVEAVEALRRTLRDGYRPETDHARIAEGLTNGEFLLMPSETRTAVGIKVLTVAPDNPALGLPRIQGVYILLDAHTLQPTLLIDGPALTDLRTSAVSFAAVKDAVLRRHDPLEVVVYGASQQARAHVRTLATVIEGEREISSITAIVRNPAAAGVDFADVRQSGSEEAEAATSRAGLIVCATTARTPLFPGELVREDAVVIAVGSHEADARELDSQLMGRADAIVEDRGVALRECGDVVLAIADGALAVDDLLPMADVATGKASLSGDRPVVFKSAGMPWEDLVIAEALAAEHRRRA